MFFYLKAHLAGEIGSGFRTRKATLGKGMAANSRFHHVEVPGGFGDSRNRRPARQKLPAIIFDIEALIEHSIQVGKKQGGIVLFPKPLGTEPSPREKPRQQPDDESGEDDPK